MTEPDSAEHVSGSFLWYIRLSKSTSPQPVLPVLQKCHITTKSNHAENTSGSFFCREYWRSQPQPQSQSQPLLLVLKKHDVMTMPNPAETQVVHFLVQKTEDVNLNPTLSTSTVEVWCGLILLSRARGSSLGIKFSTKMKGFWTQCYHPQSPKKDTKAKPIVANPIPTPKTQQSKLSQN